jgi:hypothetical protein
MCTWTPRIVPKWVFYYAISIPENGAGVIMAKFRTQLVQTTILAYKAGANYVRYPLPLKKAAKIFLLTLALCFSKAISQLPGFSLPTPIRIKRQSPSPCGYCLEFMAVQVSGISQPKIPQLGAMDALTTECDAAATAHVGRLNFMHCPLRIILLQRVGDSGPLVDSWRRAISSRVLVVKVYGFVGGVPCPLAEIIQGYQGNNPASTRKDLV